MQTVSPTTLALTAAVLASLTVAPMSQGSADPLDLRPASPTSVATAAAKQDRGSFAPLRGEAKRATVTRVEWVGASALVFKDHGGTVLYRSDPRTGTTVVAKNADLPVVTLNEGGDGPVTSSPAERGGVGQEQGQRAAPPSAPVQPPEGPRRRPMPAGCEGMVSALAGSGASRVPSLCLAQAATTAARS